MDTAILGFLGIIVGASLQYVFTRYLENQRHRRDLRTQAYTDYLKCVSESAHLIVQPQAPAAREIFASTADAKARICLYGSTKVIQTFSTFEKLGAAMKDDQQRKAFVDMVSAMRSDSGNNCGRNVEDLERVLFGNHGMAT